MENNIVQDFQNLRVFSSYNINRMDELVQDLTNALEETSKGIRSGGNQENNTAGAVVRRYHKKRRGARRTAVNLWKRGTISEASESSIDEAIRDYIDNVVTHSDSDDLALNHRKHRLMVPVTEPIPPVESDSFTENLSPMRPQRRRRRYKHMAVDVLQSVDGPDMFNNAGSKISSTETPVPVATSPCHSSGSMLHGKKRESLHNAGGSAHVGGQNITPGKRKRTGKSRSESTKTESKNDGDKESLDLDKMEIASISQESSSLSSSEFDSDVYINVDEGREADDEQSDFFHEPGPVCGIPEIIRWWENERVMDSDMAAGNQEFDSILFGTLAHLPESSQRSFRNRVDKLMARAESGREIKFGRRKLKGKMPRYTMMRFLQDREKWNMMQGGYYSPGASWNNGSYSNQSGDYKRRRQTPPPFSSEGGFVGHDAPPIPESNIGNQILQNMGWTPGSGLGAEGDGRQDPVIAFLHRGRRGLGYETQSDA